MPRSKKTRPPSAPRQEHEYIRSWRVSIYQNSALPFSFSLLFAEYNIHLHLAGLSFDARTNSYTLSILLSHLEFREIHIKLGRVQTTSHSLWMFHSPFVAFASSKGPCEIITVTPLLCPLVFSQIQIKRLWSPPPAASGVCE